MALDSVRVSCSVSVEFLTRGPGVERRGVRTSCRLLLEPDATSEVTEPVLSPISLCSFEMISLNLSRAVCVCDCDCDSHDCARLFFFLFLFFFLKSIVRCAVHWPPHSQPNTNWDALEIRPDTNPISNNPCTYRGKSRLCVIWHLRLSRGSVAMTGPRWPPPWCGMRCAHI